MAYLSQLKNRFFLRADKLKCNSGSPHSAGTTERRKKDKNNKLKIFVIYDRRNFWCLAQFVIRWLIGSCFQRLRCHWKDKTHMSWMKGSELSSKLLNCFRNSVQWRRYIVSAINFGTTRRWKSSLNWFGMTLIAFAWTKLEQVLPMSQLSWWRSNDLYFEYLNRNHTKIHDSWSLIAQFA